MTTIDPTELAHVTGGMRTDGFRQSTNIEDRRSPAAIARDNAWWTSTHAPTPAPSQPGQ
jgi:hypothetical protein